MESLENNPLTARKYLESLGIDMGKTALLSVIGGYMRTPDLCTIMENYAKEKIKEAESAKVKKT